MTIRIARTSWFCCLLVMTPVWLLPGVGRADTQVIEATVRVSSAKQPSLYLRFRNNKLWMSATKAGLEKATPIRASKVGRNKYENTNAEYRYYDFPEVDLPLSLPGIEKVRARFYSARTIGEGNNAQAKTPADQTRIAAVYDILRRDSSGARWSYEVHDVADCDTSKLSSQQLHLVLPSLDPKKLTLGIEVKVEQRNARIGLQVKAGDKVLDKVLKGGTEAPASIKIVTLKGKTITSEKGDLQKFGFT